MNFITDVIELDVFDQEGNLVTKLDKLQEGDLIYNTDGVRSYIGVRDVLFNTEILKHMGIVIEPDNKTDFEKAITKDEEELVIKFKKKIRDSRFKLIARGISYDPDTNKINKEFKIIVPFSKLKNGYSLETKCDDVSKFDYVFELLPYNDDEDLFEMRIKNRD